MILILLLIFAFLTLALVRHIEQQSEEPNRPPAACPACTCRVELDWLICPHCKELLQRPCNGCGERMPLSHNFCSQCGIRHQPARLEEVAACA